MKLIRAFPDSLRPLQVGEFALDFYGNGKGIFKMMCPSANKMCGVAIVRGDPDAVQGIHGWDGNQDAPTITPSIGCDLAPRCGWHGHIIGGVRTP